MGGGKNYFLTKWDSNARVSSKSEVKVWNMQLRVVGFVLVSHLWEPRILWSKPVMKQVVCGLFAFIRSCWETFFFFLKRNRAIFAVGLQLPLHLSIDTIKISLNKEFKLGHNINNNRWLCFPFSQSMENKLIFNVPVQKNKPKLFILSVCYLSRTIHYSSLSFRFKFSQKLSMHAYACACVCACMCVCSTTWER